MKPPENHAYRDRDLLKGAIKIMILSYIKHHKTYPYELLRVIKTVKPIHGYTIFDPITKNDIYNLTSALEKEGYLRSKATLKGNKVQKVFTLTKRGEKVVKNKDKIFFAMVDEMKKFVKEEFND